jgi:hypothetical protein
MYPQHTNKKKIKGGGSGKQLGHQMVLPFDGINFFFETSSHYVSQAGLRTGDPPAYDPQVLGL